MVSDKAKIEQKILEIEVRFNRTGLEHIPDSEVRWLIQTLHQFIQEGNQSVQAQISKMLYYHLIYINNNLYAESAANIGVSSFVLKANIEMLHKVEALLYGNKNWWGRLKIKMGWM